LIEEYQAAAAAATGGRWFDRDGTQRSIDHEIDDGQGQGQGQGRAGSSIDDR